MAAYIEAADITDLMLNEAGWATKLAAKIVKSEDAANDMLKTMGLTSSDVADTVPYLFKEWNIAWVGMEMCFDAMGKNNISLPEFEKYRVKWEVYQKRLKNIQSQLTPSVIAGTDYDVRDRSTAMTGILFRN